MLVVIELEVPEPGENELSVEDLRKQLYTRAYDNHLLAGMSTEDCQCISMP